jgi:hypothetical protein
VPEPVAKWHCPEGHLCQTAKVNSAPFAKVIGETIAECKECEGKFVIFARSPRPAVRGKFCFREIVTSEETNGKLHSLQGQQQPGRQ